MTQTVFNEASWQTGRTCAGVGGFVIVPEAHQFDAACPQVR